MYSLAFPNMFSNQRTYLYEDHNATANNLRLLLLSDKMSLIGDPYYGTNLKRLLYGQSKIIKDLVIDDIYKAICLFMPQLKVERKDIKVSVNKMSLYVTIRCINDFTHVNDLYNIQLMTTE